MRLARRKFLQLTAGAAVVSVLPRLAWAQTYPARTVTLIVFVPAGAIPDIVARMVAESLSQRLGQPVIIENRPGAGGNVALQAVARAPADGHTLLLIASPHAINVTLYEKNPISLTRNIDPVASINSDTFVLLVNPSFPAQSVAEFIAYAKANPGKINMGSNGTGNLPHLAGELLRMTVGAQWVHVPYRGTPAAFAALMAGDIHALLDTVGASKPLIQAGKLRALGVTAPKRIRALPDVPPISETVPGYAVTGWLGIGVPKGTPAAIVKRLNEEINAVLGEPALRARMTDLGSDPLVGSTADFAKLIAEETEKWGNVVKSTGLKVE
jgi:tripartite-type tricarboxylate transporter receptor subunit TctC